MPDWLQHPHADFVAAAYAVALAGLLGLLLVSLRALACAKKRAANARVRK